MAKKKPGGIRIMITGGGTGGHVTPALATVQEIKRLAGENPAGWQPIFRYIGSQQGVEKKLAAGAGLDFVGIQTGKLRRANHLLGLLTFQNLTDLFRIPVGVGQALWQVARFKPDVIFSTGGFVCVPPVIAGWLWRVPVLTHEQTVTVGLANRIAARFARRIALSFEGAVSELPARLRPRTFVTGNPVRPLIFQGDRERAIQEFNFSAADNHLPTVYVTGGAQGARIINQAVEAVLPELLENCRIIHQCGQQPAGETQDYDRLQAAAAKLAAELRGRYYLARFVGEEIGDIFALSELVVSRAGAGTVTEIAATGKPAIFIPLVPTGGDEQTRNAQRAEAVGAARIIKQRELSGPRLLEEVRELLADRENLHEMGRKAAALARPNAAHDLAEAVIELGLNRGK
jgi:UDP-N-acetylglucosamine--N-acetylmuramyl-(pentapeptide) pyrophosphoryl-undecaprenol N-acetylglucosamine transferase